MINIEFDEKFLKWSQKILDLDENEEIIYEEIIESEDEKTENNIDMEDLAYGDSNQIETVGNDIDTNYDNKPEMLNSLLRASLTKQGKN